MLNKCPICEGELIIKEYYCKDCDVTLRGDFDTEKSESLMGVNPEILEFIKVFIYAEGNIKKVEGILNCSYPKVKSLLSKAKKNLGIESVKENEEDKKRKNEILEKLDNGKISFEKAMDLLNK
ncbi:MAG: DUF2089 domain-containing protein [Candidatus Mcinerneyibacterium aminivorans]|uniref:DUF2089 domain-containing protein n=1 Tax=Candidatus Mcinerneyibacterium aminivorans TaxID=2703815 RepID=A0A5D0MLC7_9BACT|nr:MAG: DUF2089 domain-containing protein [Candidatus Mcinerneyibacterium aminivorans]